MALLRKMATLIVDEGRKKLVGERGVIIRDLMISAENVNSQSMILLPLSWRSISPFLRLELPLSIDIDRHYIAGSNLRRVLELDIYEGY
jgi:hypothetical protein